MAGAFYDDNYGHWEIEDQSDIDFFRKTQEENVEKKCEGCGGVFQLRPQAGFCNSCADARERGWI
jgi:rRNA maturation endonuclease Nob1